MFRVGDPVLHVGKGSTQRGKEGIVCAVEGSKQAGKVYVRWNAGYPGRAEYSAAWARENLAVDVRLLRSDYSDFQGAKYVAKYWGYAGTAESLIRTGLKPHRMMKAEIEGPTLGIPIMSDCPNFVDAQESLLCALNSVQLKPTTGCALTYPLLAMSTTATPGSGLHEQRYIPDAEALAALPEGKYELYTHATKLEVKPIAKTELVFG